MYILFTFLAHNSIIFVCIGVSFPDTIDSKSLEELETAKKVQKLGKSYRCTTQHHYWDKPK